MGSLRKNEEQKAGRALVQARQESERHEKMLEQLLQYQSEYRALFREQSAAGIDVSQYQNYEQFLRQLEAAVAEQRRALGAGESIVEENREQWVKRRQATESLARLSHGLRADVVKERERNEQKQTDESSARRFQQQRGED